jgi:microcin C transport system substrate-binding protein
VGGLPVFSRKWGMENGKPKPFDQVVMDIPIGSGPYRIGPVRFGKDITYVRDPVLLGARPERARGTSNFRPHHGQDLQGQHGAAGGAEGRRIRLDALLSAGDWARRVNGKRFTTGELVKGEFKHRLPAGFQSYVLNTRRPLLKDVRVREALGLAMDYEWMNRQMFYNAYQRVAGLFGNTDCQATGEPGAEELALLAPWRGKVPMRCLAPCTVPPRTDGDSSLRANLRRARELLRQAGWEVQGGVLRNAKGEALVLEYMDSNEAVRAWSRPGCATWKSWASSCNFRRWTLRCTSSGCRSSTLTSPRMAYQGTHNPGQEFADLFGSKAADTEDSGNHAGVKSPAVDDMIRRMTGARTKAELLPACRALERVIAHSHYLMPQWTAGTHRMAYNAWRLALPPPCRPYANSEAWAIDTWWKK